MNIQLLKEIRQKIEMTTDCFYQQKNQQGYKILISVIDDLMIIAAELKNIEENEAVQTLKIELAQRLQEITEAMLQKDTILIADMMKYDIIELLDKMEELDD